MRTLLLSLLMITRLLSAATWHVPQDLPSLSQAFLQVVDGDSVVVAPGVYHESGLVLSHAITLTGERPDSLDTVIDGDQSGQAILTLSGCGPCTLVQGLLLRNGHNSDDGGAVVATDCQEVVLRTCRLEGNSAYHGGALFLGAGSSLSLESCEVVANEAIGNGRGIFNDGDLRLSNCRISDHSESREVVFSNGPLELTSCLFENNNGGIWCRSGSESLVENCLFRGNRRNLISASPGSARLIQCQIADNEGVRLLYGRLHLEDCTIFNNHCDATMLQGRGLQLEGCYIVDNHSAGVAISYDTLRLVDCLIAGNRADAAPVSSVLRADHSIEMDNSTVTQNSGCLSLFSAGTRLAVSQSLIAFNRSGTLLTPAGDDLPELDVACTGMYGNVAQSGACETDGDWSERFAPLEWVDGNWRGDPRLRDPSADDFRPATGSPCRPEGNACGVRLGALDVVDEDPAPLAWFSLSPTGGPAPLNVQLQAWPGGDATDWEWDLDGDGGSDATGALVEHTFTESGSWTLGLRATGPGGARTLIREEALAVGGRLLRVPLDYATPSAALAVALPGDTVELACGDYLIEGTLELVGGVVLRAVQAGCARLRRAAGAGFTFLEAGYLDQHCVVEGLEVRSATESSGIHIRSTASRVTLKSCRMVGGILAWCDSLFLEDCLLDSLHEVQYDSDSRLELRRCRLRDCGELGASSDQTTILEHCLLERLSSLSRYMSGSSLVLNHCTLVDCGIPGVPMSRGIGFLLLDACIVGALRGPMLNDFHSPDSLVVRDTDIWNNAEGDWVGPLAPFLGQDGNIAADPLFCDFQAGDFRLDAATPCLLDSLGLEPMGAFPVGCGIDSLPEPPARPLSPVLAAPVPNPFNASCWLRFTLPQAGPARLTIHDLAGRQVATLVDGPAARGEHAIRWDAAALPSGIYFSTLKTAQGMATRKIILVK